MGESRCGLTAKRLGLCCGCPCCLLPFPPGPLGLELARDRPLTLPQVHCVPSAVATGLFTPSLQGKPRLCF